MILSAGLSPVWQQILVFDGLTPGEVNRASEVQWCASGKSLNAARAIMALGARGLTISTCGGMTGRAIRDEFNRDEIPTHWIETCHATRVCTTVIDRQTGTVTELVENAPIITPDELQQFEAAFESHKHDANLIVLSGSLPPVEGRATPVDLHRRMLSDAPRSILDIRGPELREALSARPLLIKPNRAELQATAGRSLTDERDVLRAMRQLNAAGAAWVLITNGAKDALLTSAADAFHLTPPAADVVNPIGCGDCLAGGVAVALSTGADLVEAVRFGMAAACDNLASLLPARLDRQRVDQWAADVHVERL